VSPTRIVTFVMLTLGVIEVVLAVRLHTTVSNAIQVLSFLLAAWVAIYGIDAWRREHTGRRQIELAEDTLTLFYEAADAIKHIRFSSSFGHEYEDVERGGDEDDAQFEARKRASVVFYRYNQHQELFNKIRAIRYRFMAQIGKDKAKPFEDLHAVISEITLAARMLATLWARNHFRNEQQEAGHRERVAKYEAVFWHGAEDPDPIVPRVEALIAEIERICRAVIEGKGKRAVF